MGLKVETISGLPIKGHYPGINASFCILKLSLHDTHKIHPFEVLGDAFYLMAKNIHTWRWCQLVSFKKNRIASKICQALKINFDEIFDCNTSTFVRCNKESGQVDGLELIRRQNSQKFSFILGGNIEQPRTSACTCIRCQNPKFESWFYEWRHLASGWVMNTDNEYLWFFNST